jgi:hypothetical protein
MVQLLKQRSDGTRDHARDIARRAGDAAGRLPTLRSRVLPDDASFKLVSLVSGVVAGAVAGAIFNRVWRAVSDTEEAPEPTALDRSIREVLLAGALQGAVFGLVKAAIGRITAQGYRRFTGNDPTP